MRFLLGKVANALLLQGVPNAPRNDGRVGKVWVSTDRFPAHKACGDFGVDRRREAFQIDGAPQEWMRVGNVHAFGASERFT